MNQLLKSVEKIVQQNSTASNDSKYSTEKNSFRYSAKIVSARIRTKLVLIRNQQVTSSSLVASSRFRHFCPKVG